MSGLRGGRNQDIDRPRIGVRMRTLHVNHAFIFGGFEFRKMGVYRGRFSGMHMNMEKRRVEHSEQKRGYRSAGRHFSHAHILSGRGLEVNCGLPEE